MRAFLALVLMFGASNAGFAAESMMIPVMERSGSAYVAGTELSRSAGIAVKPLPSIDVVVACSGDRCAPVMDFFREAGEIWVSTAALAKALALTARFSADKRQVRFELAIEEQPTGETIARVGQLAPNLRISKLGGGTVSLSDFRGKRVLINSWASW